MSQKAIYIKVTLEQHTLLHEKAKNCGMTLSNYLRSLGLNYPVNSIVDQLAFGELLKVKGDLGRLGGLLKLWITNNRDNPYARLGNRTQTVIAEDYNKILKLQEELLNIARRML